MKTKLGIAWVLLLALDAGAAQAEGHGLKAVMQHLGMELHHIGDGLLMNDLPTVERAARTIAGHGHLAPADEKRIAAALGREMKQFREADELVHHRALELAEAAHSGNAALALQHHAALMAGCIACHTQFRERLRTPD